MGQLKKIKQNNIELIGKKFQRERFSVWYFKNGLKKGIWLNEKGIQI